MNVDAVADVAQLVRASGCGSEGRGFDSHHSPHTIVLLQFYKPRQRPVCKIERRLNGK